MALFRLIRRLVFLGVIGGGAVAAMSAYRRRQLAPVGDGPVWPPLQPVAADTAPAGIIEKPRWLAPIDGQCPDGYPIKANENSGIFHVPGGRFYDRTIAERCYANADDAIADGYRAAKA